MKLIKSEIFKLAHKLAREEVAETGGDYSKARNVALKLIHKANRLGVSVEPKWWADRDARMVKEVTWNQYFRNLNETGQEYYLKDHWGLH